MSGDCGLWCPFKDKDGRNFVGNKEFVANNNNTSLADEEAKAKARAWRVGKSRVWAGWWTA